MEVFTHGDQKTESCYSSLAALMYDTGALNSVYIHTTKAVHRYMCDRRQIKASTDIESRQYG